MYYVYILTCGDGSLYTGTTNDVEKRVKTHNSGKGAKYTRSHLPVTLSYVEELPDKSAALRREAEIKRMSRGEKMRLVGRL
jgi:putative endonuclease